MTLPDPNLLLARFDAATGRLDGRPPAARHLADLDGSFADAAAYAAARAAGNPLLYTVAAAEPASGPGDLHYGLGVLQPGRIGAEYYLTKGHLHTWRPAAEVYIGLRGAGAMLLEPEDGGEARLVPLTAGSVVYVPGFTAHRTVNTGVEPLAYLGVYPAAAGHDYQVIARNNFRHVVIERGGRPVLLPRADFLATLH